MEFYCYVWAFASKHYLDIFDSRQKQFLLQVNVSVNVVDLLTHCPDVASLSHVIVIILENNSLNLN